MPYAELNIDQGSSFETTLDLVGEDGALINVAGCVFTGQIRKSYYSTNAVADFAFTFPPIISGNLAGNLTISLTSSQTSNIKPGRYLYDVKVVDVPNSNTVTRIVEGIVTITPQVTR